MAHRVRQEELRVLTVSVQDLGEEVILSCSGRIERGFESAILCAALQRFGRNIVVDLSDVDGIDAAGVGAMIALQAAGVYVKLRNPSGRVRKLLGGAEGVFEICVDGEPVDGDRSALSTRDAVQIA
jgi:anti-anti-sigma regulatory factor